ncbi:hypothetical protein [Mesorhizobium sp.]|uniref:hypothetical protein n=1 Tax=Mesorhizobium sp. TaxID=1871066 RepID=UPI0032AF11FA
MTDATLLDQGNTVSFARQHERATHANYAPANDSDGPLFNHGDVSPRAVFMVRMTMNTERQAITIRPL